MLVLRGFDEMAKILSLEKGLEHNKYHILLSVSHGIVTPDLLLCFPIKHELFKENIGSSQLILPEPI